MMDDCCEVPAPQPTRRYFPDEIILYGVPLDGATAPPRTAMVQIDSTYTLAFQVWAGRTPVDANTVAIAVIYGYSFEGSCYRFDKPRLMVFETLIGQADANGCGFERSTAGVPGYYMWRVSSKQIMLELNVTIDEAETIVLSNNLPGRRSPSTYSASMQLAHRGGRLTNTSV
jgi:hypothetical protein